MNIYDYVAMQPKGTFTNEQLQSFVNVDWLTQDQYNELAVTDTQQQPASSAPAASTAPASQAPASSSAPAESSAPTQSTAPNAQA